MQDGPLVTAIIEACADPDTYLTDYSSTVNTTDAFTVEGTMKPVNTSVKVSASFETRQHDGGTLSCSVKFESFSEAEPLVDLLNDNLDEQLDDNTRRE